MHNKTTSSRSTHCGGRLSKGSFWGIVIGTTVLVIGLGVGLTCGLVLGENHKKESHDANLSNTINHGNDANSSNAINHGNDVNSSNTINHGNDANSSNAINHRHDGKSSNAINHRNDGNPSNAINHGNDANSSNAINQGNDDNSSNAINYGNDGNSNHAINHGNDDNSNDAINHGNDGNSNNAQSDQQGNQMISNEEREAFIKIGIDEEYVMVNLLEKGVNAGLYESLRDGEGILPYDAANIFDTILKSCPSDSFRYETDGHYSPADGHVPTELQDDNRRLILQLQSSAHTVLAYEDADGVLNYIDPMCNPPYGQETREHLNRHFGTRCKKREEKLIVRRPQIPKQDIDQGYCLIHIIMCALLINAGNDIAYIDLPPEHDLVAAFLELLQLDKIYPRDVNQVIQARRENPSIFVEREAVRWYVQGTQ